MYVRMSVSQLRLSTGSGSHLYEVSMLCTQIQWFYQCGNFPSPTVVGGERLRVVVCTVVVVAVVEQLVVETRLSWRQHLRSQLRSLIAPGT